MLLDVLMHRSKDVAVVPSAMSVEGISTSGRYSERARSETRNATMLITEVSRSVVAKV